MVVRYRRRLVVMAIGCAALSLGLLASVGGPSIHATQATSLVRPNDPYYKGQLAFFYAGGTTSVHVSSTKAAKRTIVMPRGISLDLPRTWAITTGSRAVTVAVLDDGFLYSHEDISANLWRNPGETRNRRRGRFLSDERKGR